MEADKGFVEYVGRAQHRGEMFGALRSEAVRLRAELDKDGERALI